MSDEQGGEVETKLGFLIRLLSDDSTRPKILGRPGKLRFNLMTEEIECGGERLGVENSDLVPIQHRIAVATAKLGQSSAPSFTNLAAVIEHLASLDEYHPVEEWVTGLSWDGHDRLTGELPAAFGHEAGTIEATFLRKTLRAMVARAVIPGCKVDTVLVLRGPQAKFKSTALAALGGRWFCDQHLDIGNKDSTEICHRSWLIELGELGSIRGRDVEQVKAFVSKRDDVWHARYAKKSRVRKRRFVFVGTTNQAEFLSDDTGNRRWWPLVVEKDIDVMWLGQHREQLFAQAAREVNGGAQWYLEDAEEKASQEAAARDHMAVDPWEPAIIQWMADNEEKRREGVSVAEVLGDALKLSASQCDHYAAKRARAVLRTHGAENRVLNGVRKWRW